MRKIIGESFKAKCAKMLTEANGNLHSVARRLKCSPSTVYRATGGKRRSNAGGTDAWVEQVRKARTKTGRSNGVQVATKANLRKVKTARRRKARAAEKAAYAARPKHQGNQHKRKLTPRGSAA